MIIGLTGSFRSDLDSLEYLFPLILRGLESSGHTVLRLPEEYRTAFPETREQLVRDMLKEVDVVFGLLDPFLLRVRSKQSSSPPCLILVLGGFPRGGLEYERVDTLIVKKDVLICNSYADLALVKKFFPDALTVLLHFPCADIFFDCNLLKIDARKRWGLSGPSQVVLYTGRLTLEKNVHSLLRIFAMMHANFNYSILIIAGRILDTPFYDWDIEPVHYSKTVDRIVQELGIQSRVLFVGQRSRSELAELYRAADVFVTTSIHHDENFGLSPVEAMACSLPVIAPAWGGFRDTVIDGVTGFHIPVRISRQSPVLDWPKALDKLGTLLGDNGLQLAMGMAAKNHAVHKFRETVFIAKLHSIVESVCSISAPFSALTSSPFAKQVWSSRAGKSIPPTEEGRTLYRKLIQIYAAPNDKTDGDYYVLAAPFSVRFDLLWVEHALIVGRYLIPQDLRKDVELTAAIFQKTLTIKASGALLAQRNIDLALHWLVEVGALLRTTESPKLRQSICDIAISPLFREEDFTGMVAIVM